MRKSNPLANLNPKDTGPGKGTIYIIEIPVKGQLTKLLSELDIGAPIQVKCSVDSEPPAIYAVNMRDGESWDIMSALSDWSDCVVVSHQRDGSNRIIRTFVAMQKKEYGSEIQEFPVYPQQASQLRELTPGSPVHVKRYQHNGREYIIAVKKREGHLWDVFPSKVGVIDRVNISKGITHVIISHHEDCLIYHDRFPDLASFGIGEFLSIRNRTFQRKDQIRHDLLTAEPTIEHPSKDIYKEFCGTFRFPRKSKWEYEEEPSATSATQNYGFISASSIASGSDIFVPPDLVTRNSLQDGAVIKGIAIQSFNRKKKRWGWEAIKIN